MPSKVPGVGCRAEWSGERQKQDVFLPKVFSVIREGADLPELPSARPVINVVNEICVSGAPWGPAASAAPSREEPVYP